MLFLLFLLATIIVPQSRLFSANAIDDEPFVSTAQLTLSPTLTEHEIQKMALAEQFRQDLPTQEEATTRYKELKKKYNTVKGSKRPNLTLQEMNFIELTQRKNELLLQGDYNIAIKYLERMLKIAETTHQVVFVMLELAELLMQVGKYAKAEKLFAEFIQLYPGSEYVEQAFVKAILCSWEQTNAFDRDQTKTEETLALIGRFEQRQAICSTGNIAAVAEIKKSCEEKLAAGNLYVAQHYIGRGIFRSAHKRLNSIRTVDLCKLPELEPELLRLELELAQAEKNKDIELAKRQELISKYPNHEITLALLPKGEAPQPTLLTAQQTSSASQEAQEVGDTIA